MVTENEIPLMQSDIRGSGEPLVLVPGSLTGWLSWIPHAEVLAASRKVIRVQMHSVAFGLEEAPLPTTYSVGYEVAALGKTLDALEIEVADFAAWSYGAEVTLSYAIHHVDRVRSLTMIEPPAFWVLRKRGSLPQELLDEQELMRAFDTRHVTEEQLVHFIHFAGLIPEDIDPRSIPQWSAWLKHRQSLRIGDRPFTHEDNIEYVRQFDKPVLMIKGEGSSKYYHEIIDMLAEELPDASIETYPGRHAPHIISMQPFMERFTEFLSNRT